MRPLYVCVSLSLCVCRFGLEQLFIEYGVDVYVAGHTYDHP
jgi:hypothetical protein